MAPSLFKNLVSNWFGFCVAAITGLVLSPIVAHSLGKELFGIWNIIIAVTGQLMILDLGVRNSVVKFCSEYRSREDRPGLIQLISNALLLLIVQSLFGFLIILLLLPFLESWFEINASFASLAKWVLIVSAIDAAIEVGLGAFDATLAGFERYDLLNGIGILRLLLNLPVVVFVLNSGYGLIGLVTSILAIRILQRSLIVIAALRVLKDRPRLKHVRLEGIKQIQHYGYWAFLIVLATRIINQAAPLIAGIFLGPALVAIYAVPHTLMENFRLFTQSGSTVLTPRLSYLEGQGDREQAAKLLFHWTRMSELFALSITLPLLIFGPDFILLWMGDEYIDSIPILKLLVIPYLFVLPAQAFANFLYSTSKHSIGAKLQLIEASLVILFGTALAPSFGPVGVALGVTVPGIFLRGFILPRAVCKHFQFSFLSYLSTNLISMIPLAVAYIATLILFKDLIGTATWLRFLCANGIAFTLFWIASFLLYFSDEERGYIRRRIRL